MSNKKNQRIINEALINQSVIDLLIEKQVFTEDELREALAKNVELFRELAKEYSKLIIDKQKLDIKYELDKELDEDVLGGLYYGPKAEA